MTSAQVATRIAELRELKDGWADGTQHASTWGSGSGKAPLHKHLDYLESTIIQKLVLPPAIFPIPDTGGVVLEWTVGDREISLEIDFRYLAAEYHDLNLHTDDSVYKILPLSEPNTWTWINERLTQTST